MADFSLTLQRRTADASLRPPHVTRPGGAPTVASATPHQSDRLAVFSLARLVARPTDASSQASRNSRAWSLDANLSAKYSSCSSPVEKKPEAFHPTLVSLPGWRRQNLVLFPSLSVYLSVYLCIYLSINLSPVYTKPQNHQSQGDP